MSTTDPTPADRARNLDDPPLIADAWADMEDGEALTTLSSMGGEWRRRAVAAEAEAAALRLELRRHALVCLWPREGEDEDVRRLHRSHDEMVERACQAGLSPEERANRLSVAWRNWLGGGGPGVGTRMQMAADMRRVFAALEQRLPAGQARTMIEAAEGEG